MPPSVSSKLKVFPLDSYTFYFAAGCVDHIIVKCCHIVLVFYVSSFGKANKCGLKSGFVVMVKSTSCE